MVVSTWGEPSNNGRISSPDELDVAPAGHNSNGYVPADFPAEAVVVEKKPDENGFRIIKLGPIAEASNEQYVAYSYPRDRLESWTRLSVEEDSEIDQGGHRWNVGTV